MKASTPAPLFTPVLPKPAKPPSQEASRVANQAATQQTAAQPQTNPFLQQQPLNKQVFKKTQTPSQPMADTEMAEAQADEAAPTANLEKVLKTAKKTANELNRTWQFYKGGDAPAPQQQQQAPQQQAQQAAEQATQQAATDTAKGQSPVQTAAGHSAAAGMKTADTQETKDTKDVSGAEDVEEEKKSHWFNRAVGKVKARTGRTQRHRLSQEEVSRSLSAPLHVPDPSKMAEMLQPRDSGLDQKVNPADARVQIKSSWNAWGALVNRPVSDGMPLSEQGKAQRERLARLTGEEQAVSRLWSMQMGIMGRQNGAVLLRAEASPEMFSPLERSLASELMEKDKQTYGAVNGRSLDNAFFAVTERLTGMALDEYGHRASTRYAMSPLATNDAADNLTPLQAGMTRLLGGAPLMNGGVIEDKTSMEPYRESDGISNRLNSRETLALLGGDLIDHGGLESLMSRVYLEDKPAEPAQLDSSLNDLRPLGTEFPQGGNPVRYRRAVERSGEDLVLLDEELAHLSHVSGVSAQEGHLEGRFEYGTLMRKPGNADDYAAYREGRPMDEKARSRMMAYELVAYVAGVEQQSNGLEKAADVFKVLAPDARVFVQAAGLYQNGQGNGAGGFRLDAFRDMLAEKRLPELANEEGVGSATVPTLGALAAAMDRGTVTLADVTSNPGVLDKDRFFGSLSEVLDGSFNQNLASLDSQTDDRHSELWTRLDQDGDGQVRGPELAAALSTMHDVLNLGHAGATPGPDAPAVVKEVYARYDRVGLGMASDQALRMTWDFFAVVDQMVKQFPDSDTMRAAG